jgi:diguanylate cyclase (GGDEF)-like protein/PAS domain S-box-containing protein
MAWVFGLLVVTLAVGLTALSSYMLNGRVHRDKGAALAAIARGLSLALDEGLRGLRRDVRLLAGAPETWASGLQSKQASSALERLHRSQPYSAWIGVADAQGVVRSAIDGILVGQSVQQRPWFSKGLSGPYLGDVHEAYLLSAALKARADGEPWRFVDVATPIVVEGQTLGVLGMHGTWDWASAIVASVLPDDAEAQGIEVFIVDRDGRFLFRSGRQRGMRDLLELNEARQSADPWPDRSDGPTDMRWGDGQIYETVSASLIQPEHVQALQWRIVARQSYKAMYADSKAGVITTAWVGVFFAVIATVVAWLGASHLSRPIFLISNAAKAVTKGQAGAEIPQLDDSAEISDLSQSLAAMTQRLREDKEALEQRVQSRTEELLLVNRELSRLSRDQHAMLDNDIVGIMKMQSRRIRWKNRAIDRMFGYQGDELLGQSTRVLHLDDGQFDRMGEEVYGVLGRGQQFRGQFELRRKDGHNIWVDLFGTNLEGDTGESLWLLTDITALKQHQAQVEHIAFHDSLTGLANRLLLAERMRHSIALEERTHRKLAVCYIDLDGFKSVNDHHGHEGGDQLLQEVAKRIKASVRASDTAARFGGDEFVLLIGPVDRLDEVSAVLQRLVEAILQPVRLSSGAECRVSASIGVAMFPRDGQGAAELMMKADAAMYEAKRLGKNQIVYVVSDRGTGLPS